MKVAVGLLVSSMESLRSFGEQDFKGSFKFDIKKIISKVDAELKLYEEVRVDLVKKFGIEQEGSGISVPKDKEKEYFAELAPVLAKEVELPFEQIIVESLPEADKLAIHNSKLTPMDLVRLSWLID